MSEKKSPFPADFMVPLNTKDERGKEGGRERERGNFAFSFTIRNLLFGYRDWKSLQLKKCFAWYHRLDDLILDLDDGVVFKNVF